MYENPTPEPGKIMGRLFKSVIIYILIILLIKFIYVYILGGAVGYFGFVFDIVFVGVVMAPFFLIGYAINNLIYDGAGRTVLDMCLMAVVAVFAMVPALSDFRIGISAIIIGYVLFTVIWLAIARYFPIHSWKKD